jgi:hypothetical protein
MELDQVEASGEAAEKSYSKVVRDVIMQMEQ